MSIFTRHTLTFTAAVAFYTGFLVWLYYPALQLFFSADDWVFLNFIRRIPVDKPWLYFTPKAIWYYRPLHTLQFGVTYNLVGLNQFWYNVQSLVMMLANVGLVYLFIRELFGARMALVSGVLFSVSPMAPDVLLWKSNFNTIHYAAVMFLACMFFVRYLRSGSRRWYVAALVVGVLGWFTKESIVNLPFALSAIWVTVFLQDKWDRTGDPVARIEWASATRGQLIRRYVFDLLPFGLAALAYGLLRLALFENVDPLRMPENVTVNYLVAAKQWLVMITFSLFSFLYDPILVSHFGWLREAVSFLVFKSLGIPVVLLILGVYRKSPALIFAVLFPAATVIPTFLLPEFSQSRYYYVSSVGYVVLISNLALYLLEAWSTVAGRVHDLGVRERVKGYCALGLLLWLFCSSVVLFQQQIGRFQVESSFMDQAYRYLNTEGKKLPQDAVIVFQETPKVYMFGGIGIPEMTEIATGRRDLVGADAKLFNRYYRDVKFRSRDMFTLDVITSQPQFKRLEIPEEN